MSKKGYSLPRKSIQKRVPTVMQKRATKRRQTRFKTSVNLHKLKTRDTTHTVSSAHSALLGLLAAILGRVCRTPFAVMQGAVQRQQSEDEETAASKKASSAWYEDS